MKRMMIAAAALGCAVFGAGLMLYGQTAPATGSAASLPPDEPGASGNGDVATARLAKSTRHGEWMDVKVPGTDKKLKCWVVYPERPDKAPIALCIMEIFGMTDWVRATTDQLAADGFIGIAPDFLSLKPEGAAIGTVTVEDVNTDLNAARDWGLNEPSANGKVGVIGFCWGGTKAFTYAIAQPKLDAAVVFYGTPPLANRLPDEKELAKITCPVAGFFGGSDQRVTAVVAPTQEAMKKLNKTYEAHIYDSTGHGFMRQQTGQTPQTAGNKKAAETAWPLAIQFLTEHTK